MGAQHGLQPLPIRGRQGGWLACPGFGCLHLFEPRVFLSGEWDHPERCFAVVEPGSEQEPGPAKAGILAIPKGFGRFEGGLVPDLELQPFGMLVQPTPQKVSMGDPVASVGHDIRKIPPIGLGYTL